MDNIIYLLIIDNMYYIYYYYYDVEKLIPTYVMAYAPFCFPLCKTTGVKECNKRIFIILLLSTHCY